jgi:hypothetical protein
VEIFYVMEGSFEFLLEDLDNPVRVASGGVVHVPSRTIHTFKNVGTAAGKLLVTLLPGNFEKFFRALGKPVGGTGIPDLNSPPDPASVDAPALLSVASAFGLEFILPG